MHFVWFSFWYFWLAYISKPQNRNKNKPPWYLSEFCLMCARQVPWERTRNAELWLWRSSPRFYARRLGCWMIWIRIRMIWIRIRMIWIRINKNKIKNDNMIFTSLRSQLLETMYSGVEDVRSRFLISRFLILVLILVFI